MSALPIFTETGAMFDVSKRYRYRLWRSTADEAVLDPTVRRCVTFASDWGYGRLEVVNLFALRSTDPAALYGPHDAIGPDNDSAIETAARGAELVIAAWGRHGRYRDRGGDVLDLLARGGDVYAVRILNDGSRTPGHPLYVPRAEKPKLLQTRKAA